MFKGKYSEIYDRVTPDKQLVSDTLELKRVSKGYRTKRTTRFIAIPVGAVASLMISFVLLVNLSPSFAQAVEPIPVLRELAAIVNISSPLREAVDFSPSLSAAVDNEYVQVIGQEQTVNGITMRVEYVIVDEQQLHVFYTLHSGQYYEMFLRDRSLHDTNGIPLEGYTSHITRSLQGYWDGDIKQEELRHLVFIFSDSEVSGDLIFEAGVIDTWDSEYETVETTAFSEYSSPIPISLFSFTFSFNTELIPETEIISVDQSFSFDGQDFTVTTIDISPTRTRINIVENETNTAWLRSLSAYLIDENGNRFEQTGYCQDNKYSQSKTTYYLESSFFAKSENLTLVISDAVWLDKNTELTKIDLIDHSASNLPPGVELVYIGQIDNNYIITFSAQNREPTFTDMFFYDMGRQIYLLFEHVFLDEAGNIFDLVSVGSTTEAFEKRDSPVAWAIYLSPEEYEQLIERENNLAEAIPGYVPFNPEERLYWEKVETPGRFGQDYIISDYYYDVVYLKPFFSGMSRLATPIEIIVR